MSTRRPRLFIPLALASVLLTPALVAPLARPAAAQAAPEAERTFMRVTAPTLDVKSGPQDYYYGFFKLAEGDIVEVVDQKANGFTSILTKGPRFVAGYALLRVREDESFTISGPERATATGRAARVGMSEQRLQVLYPNIDETDLLNRSWRMIRRIDPRTEVQVMGSPITGEGVSLYRIPLPIDALGFVPSDQLAPATEAEAADFLSWEANPAAWLARRRAEAEERRLAAEAAAAETARLAAAEAAEAERRLAAAQTPAEAETAPPVATPEREVPATTDPETSTESGEAGTGTGTDESSETETAEQAGGDAETQSAGDTAEADASGTDETADAVADADAGDDAGESADDEPSGSDAVSKMPPAERLDALEQAFDLLRDEDVRRVEVTPLAGLYRAFAADMTAEDPDKATFATTRARQLELWARLQAQRDRIDALRADVSETNVALAEAARTIQSQLGFNAVGRLASSRIFDGVRLPRLLRLEALDSGRTIAYVRDIGRLDLDSRVGEIVGLFGDRTYDPGLQLDILDAERVRSVRLDVEEGAGVGPAGD